MSLLQRHVFWALVGALAGVLLAQRPPTWLALFCLTLASAGGLARLAAPEDGPWFRRQAVPLLLVVLFALAGAARQQMVTRERQHDEAFGLEGVELDCTGSVTEPARVLPGKVRFHFQVERVEGKPQLGPFPVLVEVRGPDRFLPDLAPGEKWRLLGRLRPLPEADYPGGYNARIWAAQRGIHYQMRIGPQDCDRLRPPEGWRPWALTCRVRLWLLDRIHEQFGPSQRGLLAGILLGETGNLPRSLEDDFRALGLTHLLAASGLNVGIVSGLILWTGRRLGYSDYRLAWPSILAVWFYCGLAGGSPSIVRAAWMSSLTFAALALGRQADAWQTFLLTSLSLTLVDPSLWTDLGFQLSFFAVLGLLVYAPSLTFAPPKGPLHRPLGWLYRGTSLTFAASLPVTPLLLQTFHQLPSLSLPANLLCGPLAETLLPLGLAATALTGLSTQLASPLIGLTQLGLDILIRLPHFLAAHFPAWELPRPALAFWLLYGTGAGLLISPRWRGLGLVCLVAGLISLTLQAGQRQGGLIIRHVRLAQGTAVWMSVAGTHVLIGESQRVQGAMLGMLRDQGVARADLVIGLDNLEEGTRLVGPLKVISQPSSLMIQYGQLQWCWRRNGSVRLEGAWVELPRRAWNLETDGPLEIWSDGRALRFHAWSDQANSTRTSKTRSQGSPT